MDRTYKRHPYRKLSGSIPLADLVPQIIEDSVFILVPSGNEYDTNLDYSMPSTVTPKSII